MERHRSGGTRFRLYPQYDEGFEPEVVEVSSPRGSLGAGPCDERMYVADARHKTAPYEPPANAPPYRGATHSPARPGKHGHFDHIAPDTPQFRAAHLFGTVRLVLDIWEFHAGRTVRWWHPDAPPRLELVPLVQWRNAQSGPGFLETGVWPGFGGGAAQPFCLNFDVVAHEVGHAILFGTMGVPPPERLDEQFLGFHESFGDLVALLGALHFSSVRARLLQQTAGNLYALNLLNRLAETAPHQQIRLASNATTMTEVAGLQLAPDGAWIDPAGLGRNAHALAEPMIGAAFDLLVEIYQHGLAVRGLVRPGIDARGWAPAAVSRSLAGIHAEHVRAYARFAHGFDAALLEARDLVAAGLVHAVSTLPPEQARFDRIAARMLEVTAAGDRAALFARLLEKFLWRGIDPRPFLKPASPPRHDAKRTGDGGVLTLSRPVAGCLCAGLSHVQRARGLMPHAHRAA